MGDDPCYCQSTNSLEDTELLKYLKDRKLLRHLRTVLNPTPVRNRKKPDPFEKTDNQIFIKLPYERKKKPKPNKVSLKEYKYQLQNEEYPEEDIYFEKLKVYLDQNVKEIELLENKGEHVDKILKAIGIHHFWEGSLETNYANRLHSLLWIEEHYAQKELERYNQRNVTLITEAQNGIPSLYGIKVRGLADGRPSVMKEDFVFIHKTNYRVYESRIKVLEKDRDEIYVAPHKDKFKYSDGEKVDIEFRLNRRPYQLGHRALEQLKNDTLLLRILFPKEDSKQLKHKNQPIKNKLEFVNKKIEADEKQNEAIRNILGKSPGSDPFILIGPPGTGKTATLIEAIYQLWKKSTSQLPVVRPKGRNKRYSGIISTYTTTLPKIFICAPSNTAVDVVVKRLLGRGKHEDNRPEFLPELQENVMRVYAKTRLKGRDKDLPNCCCTSTKVADCDELRNKRIIATTTVTAGWLVDKGFGKDWFDYLFIDEAGQSTEPDILIPIAGFMHDKCNLVLAGDPKQLGPVVLSPLAKALTFDLSLMERLIQYRSESNSNWIALTTTLNNNYRSHPKIIQIPNELFYDRQLEAKGEQERIYLASDSNWEQLIKNGEGRRHSFFDFQAKGEQGRKYLASDNDRDQLIGRRHPIIFYGVKGMQECSGSSPSFFNKKEIIVMKNYIEELLNIELSGVKIEQNHIGIISPYRTQVEMIKKYLNHRKWNGIQAGSIESFQGSEKLIIIISTVKSKKAGQFLRNDRRFNVAITRAMALLIVIGDPNVLYEEGNDGSRDCWRKFIYDCDQNNSCKGKLPLALY